MQKSFLYKRIFGILAALLLFVGSVACQTSPSGGGNEGGGETEPPKEPLAWDDKSNLDEQILIGSWVTFYDYGKSSLDEQMKELTDFGVNFSLYPFSWYDKTAWDTYEDWKQIDELARKYKLFYGISGLGSEGEKNNNTPAALNNIKEWVEKLQSPYCRFADVMDEPRLDLGTARANVKEMTANFRLKVPSIEPFVNLHPSHGVLSPITSVKTYTEWVDLFLKAANGNVSYLSHDNYPFLAETTNDAELFSDMEVLRKAGYENGKLKTHAFIQSAKWNGTRMPDADELRWEFYAYLAYGFKAFSYFNYCIPSAGNSEGYTEALIDREGNVFNPELYASAKDLNFEIRSLGDVVMNSDVVAAYQTKAYPGTEPLPAEYFLRPVSGDFVISEFEGKGDADDHVMIFNNDWKSGGLKEFTADGVASAERFDPETKTYVPVDLTEGNLKLNMRAGEGIFLRIVRS